MPSFFKKSSAKLIALLFIAFFLPSCVSLNSSGRLAYVLSGRVTECSDSCDFDDWDLMKNEVLELQCKDGSVSYLALFRMTIKSKANPWIVVTNDPIHGWRKEIGKAEERNVGPRMYYLPLLASQSFAGGESEQRAFLAKLGINCPKEALLASPSAVAADDIDDYKILRRIPVPKLQEKLEAAKFSPAPDVIDFGSPSVFAWPFIAVSYIAIDLPVTITASTVFATGYGVYVLCAAE